MKKVLLIAALVLLVPFILGRITVAVLNQMYPTPELPSPAEQCRQINNPSIDCWRAMENMPEEAKTAMRSLARARAIMRITLIGIGVYYVSLIVGWLVLRRRKRSSDVPDVGPA